MGKGSLWRADRTVWRRMIFRWKTDGTEALFRLHDNRSARGSLKSVPANGWKQSARILRSVVNDGKVTFGRQ